MRRRIFAGQWRPLGFLVVMLAMAGILFVESYSDHEEEYDDIKVHADTMYIAAATIMSLAAFGSVLGMRFDDIRQPNSYRRTGALVMVVGTLGTIIIQANIMRDVCCTGTSTADFQWYLFGTMMTLFFTVAGFVIMQDAKRRKEDQ